MDIWNMYANEPASVAYLDIETTGLSKKNDKITVIGIYDGSFYRAFIQGINLEYFPEYISKYKLFVTFNGAQFDLPFINLIYPELKFQNHIDLKNELKALGFTGGLKKIEPQFGITRTDNITGLVAVELWDMYEKGNAEALERLIRYNAADVVNLKTIIEGVYNLRAEKERKETEGK